jgi:hypothetical protein
MSFQSGLTTSRRVVTPGTACWNQRFALAAHGQRLLQLRAAVGNPNALTTYQVGQLFSLALDYRPDAILELGRGYGNSTCVLTEAANAIGLEECRVLSICRNPTWDDEPPTGVCAVVPREWFAPLTTYSGDVADFDYASLLAGAKRVLVFWDAHGFDVAECVLGRILPTLVHREHLVIMHDLLDGRYINPRKREYGSNRLWRENSWTGSQVYLGRVVSTVEQAIAIVDFSSRNDLPLHSADESIDVELARDESKLAEMLRVVGDELFSRRAHWFWLSLNEAPGRVTFPPFPSFEETQAQKALKAAELQARQEDAERQARQEAERRTAEWRGRNKKLSNFIAVQLPFAIGLLTLGILQLSWSFETMDLRPSRVLMWSGLATLSLAARSVHQIYKRIRLLAIRPPGDNGK